MTRVIGKTPKGEPTKPTKLGSAGFVGDPKAEFSITNDGDPVSVSVKEAPATEVIGKTLRGSLQNQQNWVL
jgi:hypothetical protein